MSETEVPPPSDAEATLPRWVASPQAKAEVKNWGDEDKLRGVKLANDILWFKVYGWTVAAMMIFISLTFAITLGTWVWHHVTPYAYLTADQLAKIQSVIFSGSIGAIVASYMQKQLTK